MTAAASAGPTGDHFELGLRERSDAPAVTVKHLRGSMLRGSPHTSACEASDSSGQKVDVAAALDPVSESRDHERYTDRDAAGHRT